MRLAQALSLTSEPQESLKRWARGQSTPRRLVVCAAIVLRAADGAQEKKIVEALAIQTNTCALCRH